MRPSTTNTTSVANHPGIIGYISQEHQGCHSQYNKTTLHLSIMLFAAPEGTSIVKYYKVKVHTKELPCLDTCTDRRDLEVMGQTFLQTWRFCFKSLKWTSSPIWNLHNWMADKDMNARLSSFSDWVPVKNREDRKFRCEHLIYNRYVHKLRIAILIVGIRYNTFFFFIHLHTQKLILRISFRGKYLLMECEISIQIPILIEIYVCIVVYFQTCWGLCVIN